MIGGGSFDFVQEFAAKLPAMVIGSLLGVPEADQDMVRIQTDEMLHIEPGENDGEQAGRRRSVRLLVRHHQGTARRVRATT